MPRKQRFKPSRKPKPVQSAEVIEIQRSVDVAQPTGSPQDSPAVIEEMGSEENRA